MSSFYKVALLALFLSFCGTTFSIVSLNRDTLKSAVAKLDAAEASREAAITQFSAQFAKMLADHEEMKAKLDRIERNRVFPIFPRGEKPTAAAIDLKAALQDALSLIIHLGHSEDEVIAFVQQRFGVIFDKRVHLPIGGDVVKKVFQKDIAEEIHQLRKER